jgi:hypothetical protein
MAMLPHLPPPPGHGVRTGGTSFVRPRGTAHAERALLQQPLGGPRDQRREVPPRWRGAGHGARLPLPRRFPPPLGAPCCTRPCQRPAPDPPGQPRRRGMRAMRRPPARRVADLLGGSPQEPAHEDRGGPVCSQTAVAVGTSTARGPAPDHCASRPVVQWGRASAHPASRGGRRWPVRRGRPGVPGARGGGGAARAAARRRRVRPRTRGHGVPCSRRAHPAHRRSDTPTRARSGPPRPRRRLLCQARAGKGGGRRPRGAVQRAAGHRTVSTGRAPPRCAQGRGVRSLPQRPRRPLTVPTWVGEDRPGSRERPWAVLCSPRRRARGSARPKTPTPAGLRAAPQSLRRSRLAVRGAQTARGSTRGDVCKAEAARRPLIPSIAVTGRCPGARTALGRRTLPGCHTGRAKTGAQPHRRQPASWTTTSDHRLCCMGKGMERMPQLHNPARKALQLALARPFHPHGATR